MTGVRRIVNKFNRGEVSPRGLERNDIGRIEESASYMMNWMPERLGGMRSRPGTYWLQFVGGDNQYMVPFYAGLDNKAIVFINQETGQIRIRIDDERLDSFRVAIPALSDVDKNRIPGSAGETSHPDFLIDSAYEIISSDGERRSSLTYRFTPISGSNLAYAYEFEIAEFPCQVRIFSPAPSSIDLLDQTLGVGLHRLVVPENTGSTSIQFFHKFSFFGNKDVHDRDGT